MQGHCSIRQVGSQAPRILLADFPMHQQVDRIDFTGGKISTTQPETLTRLLDIAAEGLPATLFVGPDAGVRFLPQNIEPSPLIQLPQDYHRAKFAVSDQKNSRSWGDQPPNIGQQSQLLESTAMSADMIDPRPVKDKLKSPQISNLKCPLFSNSFCPLTSTLNSLTFFKTR